ncbi:Uncharacterised protein [Escherichia coli]|nr:Uncharacterised protein [Escherichia coli]
MPKLKDFLAQQMAKEIAQETEQGKVKTFHLEQFLKTHKRTKWGYIPGKHHDMVMLKSRNNHYQRRGVRIHGTKQYPREK